MNSKNKITEIYSTQDIAGFKVLVDLMELPYFFGIWLSDKKFDTWLEEQTGKEWTPKAYMFFGNSVFFEIDFEDDDQEISGVSTVMKKYYYEFDNSKIYVTRAKAGDDVTDKIPKEDVSQFDWFLTADGCLNFQFSPESIWRYSPATLEDLENAGFDREILEYVTELMREGGVFFQETFDLNTAYRLIDEAISQAEDDAGMERGALGRPDPTTWVFGGDRFTGTV